MTKRKKTKSAGQRRAEKTRKRRHRRAKTGPRYPLDEFDDSVLVLIDPDKVSGSVVVDLDATMDIVVRSDWLASEPELEDVLVDPVGSAQQFIALAKEKGLDPERMLDLTTEEREDRYFEISSEVAKRTLTEELCHEILMVLRRLRSGCGVQVAARMRQRWDRFDRSSECPTQSPHGFMTGLYEAIVHRSLLIGFELGIAAEEVMLATQVDESKKSLLQKVRHSPAVARVAEVLEALQACEDTCRKRAGRVWETGMEALFHGELVLGLLSHEELEEGLARIAKVMDYADFMDLLANASDAGATEAEVRPMVEALNALFAEILTPERLKQAHLKAISLMESAEVDAEWIEFLALVADVLESAKMAESYSPLFITSFFGEMEALRKERAAQGQEAE